MLQSFEKRLKCRVVVTQSKTLSVYDIKIDSRRAKVFDFIKEAIDVEAICNIIVSFNSMNLVLPSFSMNDI